MPSRSSIESRIGNVDPSGRRRSSVALAGLVAVSVFTMSPVAMAGHVATDGSSTCRSETNPEAETLTVNLRTVDKVYVRGSVAKIITTVRRTAGKTSTPAEGVNVIVRLDSHGTVLGGEGVTDEDGLAVVKIRLKKQIPTGSVDASVRATKDVGLDHPCFRPAEGGSHQIKNFFRLIAE